MAEYQLTATDASVIRTADGASIPNDPANRDWQDYQKWLDAGGVPDPYVPPPDPGPPPPGDTEQNAALYDHENRLRTLEGQPPLSQAEFYARLGQ